MRLERVLHLVTCHTEGVVCDVIVGGLPRVLGSTMSEKRQYFEENLDHLRTMVVLEPRGHVTRSVNALVEPCDPRAEYGVLILEADEIVDMSGGNIIGVATVLLETGMVQMQEPVTEFNLDTPAGLIGIHASCDAGKVLDVTFTNQPAFVAIRDAVIEVDGLGALRVDVAWGGMWYVLVDVADVGLTIAPGDHDRLITVGEAVKAAARRQLEVSHPLNPELGRPEAGGVQATMFTAPTTVDEHGSLCSENAVIVSPGWIDRCPCGTGTSARMAVLHARGTLRTEQDFVHTSIIGTTFIGEIAGTTTVGDHDALIPRITGRAWITGTAQVGVDPSDPFPAGFSLGGSAGGAR